MDETLSNYLAETCPCTSVWVGKQSRGSHLVGRHGPCVGLQIAKQRSLKARKSASESWDQKKPNMNTADPLSPNTRPGSTRKKKGGPSIFFMASQALFPHTHSWQHRLTSWGCEAHRRHRQRGVATPEHAHTKAGATEPHRLGTTGTQTGRPSRDPPFRPAPSHQTQGAGAPRVQRPPTPAPKRECPCPEKIAGEKIKTRSRCGKKRFFFFRLRFSPTFSPAFWKISPGSRLSQTTPLDTDLRMGYLLCNWEFAGLVSQNPKPTTPVRSNPYRNWCRY